MGSSRITAIEISGDDAVVHMREVNGARHLGLHRTNGQWLIKGL